jgi:hypothetical protein
MKSKHAYLIAFIAIMLVTITACSGEGQADVDVEPTEAPLTIWEYERVCRQGTIERAASYDPAGEGVHPIVIFERAPDNTNSYNELSNITLNLPEPWVVDYEGDPTTVELVACIDQTDEEFVETCEYEDDEESGDDTVYKLNVYNASYEVTVYTATTGEELGSATIDSTYEECPMFHMFSDEEEDTHAPVRGGDLQPILAEYVEP